MKIISQWLTKAQSELEAAGVKSARLDALILLGDVTGKDRAQLLAHPELELTHEQVKTLNNLLKRRQTHEPLAYLRQKSEFYGHSFYVSPDVLVPRPESETIIDLLKQRSKETGFSIIIDVGTGSGALAITSAFELPNSRVIAIDIDEKCLKVVSQNAKNHAVNIECIQGNLLAPMINLDTEGPIAILANLPYVPNNYQINRAAKHEPKLALYGGNDGLDLYRTMFMELESMPQMNIYVFTESLEQQHGDLMNIATTHNFIQIDKRGLIQVFKREIY